MIRMRNAAQAAAFSLGLFGLVAYAGEVANVGNAADGATGFGSVSYKYWISDYEVTAAQYTGFLNAVAQSDPLSLYSTQMPNTGNAECDIIRSGVSGSYTYSVNAASANRPVNFVSFNDAARYCNWLTTGNINTGVYTFTAGGAGVDVLSIMDHVAAGQLYGYAYALPTENEWYKAAYYNPNTSSYYLYPTQSNTQPVNYPLGTSTNEATYYYGVAPNFYTIGAPYYRTEVGAHVNTTSPYGAYDMGGNEWEWTEGLANVSNRVIRGGSYDELGAAYLNMQSTTRNGINPPQVENAVIGFRIVAVPEPGCFALLALTGMLGSLLRRRRSAC